MRALLKLVAYLVTGVFIGKVFHLEHLEVQKWYEPVTAALLAVGLYASTYGIQVDEARRHVKLILAAQSYNGSLRFVGTAYSAANQSFNDLKFTSE